MVRAMVDREKFLKILNRAQGVADHRSSMIILSTALLKAEEGRLSLSATDLEMGYRGETPANVEGKGAFCLPTRKLYEIVKHFPHETLILEGEGDQGVYIKDPEGNLSYRLSVLPAEDFPDLPELSEGAMVEIPGETLKEMLEKTLYAAAPDELHYAYSGILVTREEGNLRLVATDGHRLSLVDREVPGVEDLPLEEGVIVPRKAAREMKRMAAEESTLRLGIRDNHLLVSSPRERLLARLVERRYPNYQAVIPREEGPRVLVHRERLSEALKRVTLLSTDRYRIVRLEFSPGEVALMGSGGELGEARERIAVNYEGEPFTIAFNARYLLDVLQAMDSEVVEMMFDSQGKLCRITGQDDEGFIALVMAVAD